MNFYVQYGSRQILNLLHCSTLNISRPLYTGRKNSFCGLRTKNSFDIFTYTHTLSLSFSHLNSSPFFFNFQLHKTFKYTVIRLITCMKGYFICKEAFKNFFKPLKQLKYLHFKKIILIKLHNM